MPLNPVESPNPQSEQPPQTSSLGVPPTPFLASETLRAPIPHDPVNPISSAERLFRRFEPIFELLVREPHVGHIIDPRPLGVETFIIRFRDAVRALSDNRGHKGKKGNGSMPRNPSPGSELWHISFAFDDFTTYWSRVIIRRYSETHVYLGPKQHVRAAAFSKSSIQSIGGRQGINGGSPKTHARLVTSPDVLNALLILVSHRYFPELVVEFPAESIRTFDPLAILRGSVESLDIAFEEIAPNTYRLV